ncbi:MAG: 4Fe-4S dicluster domain-containing protein [Planctomycetes bacterium]|nr:4Fe-4S dicluster domain-containing protein [Planctomycetota bacterium]
MTRWGMVIDLDKCSGCGECVLACKSENNVPTAEPEEAQKGGALLWMQMLPLSEGSYPHVRTRFFPRPCMHCEHPPCVKVCPVGATYQSEDGITAQIHARCIGCRYCTVACPYTVRCFNWFTPQWPEEFRRMLNPDVSLRPKGVVEKCTFCVQRIQRLKDRIRQEGRSIRDEDVLRLPACAESCPSQAITFGDRDDPDSTVSRLSRSPRAFRLQEDLGTHPKVVYLSEG